MHEVDVFRDVASDAVRTVLKELLPPVLGALRRAGLLKRRRLLKEWPARLRDCVADLTPCFATTGPSFEYVVGNIGLPQSDQWKTVYYRVRMASAWFEGWDEMQKAVGERMTPEFFVKSLENLSRLLYWTSHTGEELTRLLDQTPQNNPIRKPVHALMDRYNAFLTSYEGFLLRLPTDLGMQPIAPVKGMESFFGRLGAPSSAEPSVQSDTDIDTSWVKTCDPGVSKAAREVLIEVKRQLDLMSDHIVIAAHGPTWGDMRLPPRDHQRAVESRETVLNMLVGRKVLKTATYYRGEDDGFVVIADREPVERTLDALSQRPR